MADYCASETLRASAAEPVLTPGDTPLDSPADRPFTKWTKRRMALFLDYLAEYCNVTAALKYAGMASSSLYRKRRECAAFRRAWDEALETGYARLEAELLNRALSGEEKQVLNRDGEIVTLKKVSNALGLALIKLHSTRVAAIRAMAGSTHDDNAMDAKIAIIKKLEQLAKHREKQAQREAADPDGQG